MLKKSNIILREKKRIRIHVAQYLRTTVTKTVSKKTKNDYVALGGANLNFKHQKVCLLAT